MWIKLWYTDDILFSSKYWLFLPSRCNLISIIKVGEVTITKDDTLFLKGKGQESKIKDRVESIKVTCFVYKYDVAP